jgi:nucleoside-diphosphate-sugar epimerase
MCEILTQAGHEVIGTDLPERCGEDDRRAGRFPSVVRGVGAELVPADLRRPGALERLLRGVDFVFHLAQGDGVAKRVVAAAATQGDARRVVLRAGGSTRPRLDCTLIRPVGLYGPRAPWTSDLPAAARRRVLLAPRNYDTPRPFVHARDVCRAALHLALRPDAAGGSYVVTDDSRLSRRGALRLVSKLMGSAYMDLPAFPLAARPVSRFLSRLFRTRLHPGEGNDKLKETGFRFDYPDAERGIRDTLVWFKQEGSL